MEADGIEVRLASRAEAAGALIALDGKIEGDPFAPSIALQDPPDVAKWPAKQEMSLTLLLGFRAALESFDPLLKVDLRAPGLRGPALLNRAKLARDRLLEASAGN